MPIQTLRCFAEMTTGTQISTLELNVLVVSTEDMPPSVSFLDITVSAWDVAEPLELLSASTTTFACSAIFVFQSDPPRPNMWDENPVAIASQL